jgi:integrase
MKWEDIDADGVWTIATEDREKNNAGVLPLPALALAQIETAPRIVDNPYIFAGLRRYFNGFGKSKAELDAVAAKKAAELKITVGDDWQFHDLRRTARSLMSRAGVAPNIAERVLGHAIAGVEGVYDRHAYIDEKREALARLAALVERIIDPPSENVVELQRAAE